MTLDRLLEEFKCSVEQQPWSSAAGYDARRAGLAAVVRKLRDWLYLDMGPGASWTPGEVEHWMNEILASDGEVKAAGGSTREDGQGCRPDGALDHVNDTINEILASDEVKP
jgi:hypothetical protein